MQNNKLKEITDLTVNELLSQNVILPSNYFQCFDKHAKLIDTEIEDKGFENEVNELLIKEFSEINDYVNEATKTIDKAALITKNAKVAIEEKDTTTLKELYKEIEFLQIQLEDITNNIYKDYLTKVYNKKWFYHKYLNKDTSFKDDALIILIDINDYNYISNTYNKLIADNMIIFIIKFVKKQFKEEGIKAEIVRYVNSNFLISIKNHDKEALDIFISNVKSYISGTTLKSNSGVIIKPSFKYSLIDAKKGKLFHDSLKALLNVINGLK